MFNFRINSKTVIVGKEGSGKSLFMASLARQALLKHVFWFKKTGLMRPIYSNIKFSTSFEAKAKKLGVPIFYFEDLDDIYGVTGATVFMDEARKYFDAVKWDEIPLHIRSWIGQQDKNGLIMILGTQNYMDLAKSFRRLVKALYKTVKVAGTLRPHPTYPLNPNWIFGVWGVFFRYSLNPDKYIEENEASSIDNFMGIPAIFLLKKKNYSIYDTNSGVSEPKLPNFKVQFRYYPGDKQVMPDGKKVAPFAKRFYK